MVIWVLNILDQVEIRIVCKEDKCGKMQSGMNEWAGIRDRKSIKIYQKDRGTGVRERDNTHTRVVTSNGKEDGYDDVVG